MANFNSIVLVGRLTRDPEVRMFASGSGVVNIGFVANNRRKNSSSGQWEDEPMFIDCKAFGKSVDAIAQFTRKGSQMLIQGHLSLEQWTSQDGAKRSKHVVIIDGFQFLDSKQRGEPAPKQQESAAPDIDPPPPGLGDEDVPF